ALFPRENNTFVMKSFMDHGTVAMIHVKAKAEKLVSLTDGRAYAPYSATGGETAFRVPLEPNLLTAFRWE
ncbi:MAG: hypothetical protein IJY86_10890, partial [Clostridia bacterium]|nr:hypothetical protein [Clostridia bacterium]